METVRELKRAPRMRYQEAAITQLRAEDPDTPVTPYMLKRLLATGAIPSIKVGRRRLFNYDDLLDYLRSPHPDPATTEAAESTGVIRRVSL